MWALNVVYSADEGLIAGLLAMGVYVAFRWVRFPDLTPDGSFLAGAFTFVQTQSVGLPPVLSLMSAGAVGLILGVSTASMNAFAKVPSFIAGLLTSLATYSLILACIGNNRPLPPGEGLIGNDTDLLRRALQLGEVALLLCVIAVVGLTLFARSIWGLRMRALGTNEKLARDLGVSNFAYRCLGLSIANALVGVAGAMYAERSTMADVGIAAGTTISGLAMVAFGMFIPGVLSHLPARLSRWDHSVAVALVCMILGATLFKTLVFIALGLVKPELFKLLTALLLLAAFWTARTSSDPLRNIRWS